MNIPDPVYILSKENCTFHSILFTNNADGEQLLAGTEDGQYVAWDLRSGRYAPTSLTSTERSTCLTLRFIDSTLVSQHKEGVVKLWQHCNDEWTFDGEIRLDYLGFCKLDAGIDSAGRAVLVCPKQKAGLEVYDLKTRHRITTLEPSTADGGTLGEVMACKVIDDGGRTFVVAAYESGDFSVWDVAGGRAVSRLDVTGKTECPMAFDYNVTRRRGICGSSSDTVVVFRLDSDMQLSKRHEMKIRSEGVSCVKIRPDGKVFALGCWDGKLRLFAAKTCRPIAVVDYHASTIYDVAFSSFLVQAHRSKTLLAASDKDGKISLWDL